MWVSQSIFSNYLLTLDLAHMQSAGLVPPLLTRLIAYPSFTQAAHAHVVAQHPR